MEDNMAEQNDRHRDSISPDAYRLLAQCFNSSDSDDSDDEDGDGDGTEPEYASYTMYAAALLRSVLSDACADGSPKDLKALAHLIYVAENWANT